MFEVEENSWKEETEYYQEFQFVNEKHKQNQNLKDLSSSDFFHKDEIEWLLIKEREEAILFTFFVSSVFWLIIAIYIYVFTIE